MSQRAVVLVVVLVLVSAACGRGEPAEVAGGDAGRDAPAEDATVRIRLEPIESVFIEGFDVVLRIEDGGGATVWADRWTDAVGEAAGRDPDDLEIGAFYDTVVEQAVPAGRVVLRSQLWIGMDTPTPLPDLDDPLACALDLDLAAGEVATVEVPLETPEDCPTRLEEAATPTSTTSTTTTSTSPTSTTATSTTSTTTTSPGTTTSTTVVPADLPVGSQHSVDVDLVCAAFALAGSTWVVDKGDVSTWQPPGERHEGATLTIDRPGHGTFRGDVAGTKQATFRRLGPDEPVDCVPEPRPGA